MCKKVVNCFTMVKSNVNPFFTMVKVQHMYVDVWINIDFEIIELKQQFCGNTHTHTHISIIPGMHSISFRMKKLQQRFVLYSNLHTTFTSKNYRTTVIIMNPKGYLE